MKNIWNGTNLEKVLKLSFKSNTIFNIYYYYILYILYYIYIASF